MTIEITRPEIESLIQQQLQSGAFVDAEDVILRALKSLTPEQEPVFDRQRAMTPGARIRELSKGLVEEVGVTREQVEAVLQFAARSTEAPVPVHNAGSVR
jgi:Arc/MetJ-type ribon-helix-helix transcriptional regulator